jgi:AraC family transcriptional regulator
MKKTFPLVKEIMKMTDSLDIRVSTRFSGGNDLGKHEHEHPNLVFIIAGGCAEKRQHGTYERRAADLAYLHAGEAHETTFAAIPTRYISLDIKPVVFAENHIKEEHIINAINKSPDAKFLVLKMYREMLNNDDHTTDSIAMLFYEFASGSGRIDRKKTPHWITIVYEQLNDKWNETITLKELSKAAGVNPITISKHFSAYFGCTLGDYMRKLKIARSLSLIKQEGTLLTQTALICNFSDQSHFIRNFRNYTSFSPKQYQKL